jgi:triosephosphate isomerase (TIM)
MKFVVGNWKLNLLVHEALGLVKSIVDAFESEARFAPLRGRKEDSKIWIAPTTLSLTSVATYCQSHGEYLMVGGQNCFWEDSGAFTGETSPSHLTAAGASFCLVGHSERRTLFQEDALSIMRKMRACTAASLTPLYCIGETINQRESGRTKETLCAQLSEELLPLKEEFLTTNQFPLIAYEPVWAIGTGLSAGTDDISNSHSVIRQWLEGNGFPPLHILYGGSVSPLTISDIVSLDLVNGVLVGGASIKGETFLKIVECALD